MFCHLFCEKIERDLIEIGEAPPARVRAIDSFPLYRLKRDIEAVNKTVGISVTRLLLRENLVYPIRNKLRTLTKRLETVFVAGFRHG